MYFYPVKSFSTTGIGSKTHSSRPWVQIPKDPTVLVVIRSPHLVVVINRHEKEIWSTKFFKRFSTVIIWIYLKMGNGRENRQNLIWFLCKSHACVAIPMLPWFRNCAYCKTFVAFMVLEIFRFKVARIVIKHSKSPKL